MKQQVIKWLDLVSRRKWLILLIFVPLAALGVYSAANQVHIYESRALIMVDLDKMPVSATPDPMATMAGGSSYSAAMRLRSIESELFVLQNSRVIADRVNDRFEKTGRPAGAVTFYPASRNVNNAIEVKATGTSAEEVAKLANVYAEEYVRHTQDASRSYLTTSRSFLEEQQDKRKSELQQAEGSLEAYKRATGRMGLSVEGSNMVAQIGALEAARDDARIELQMRQASLATLEREMAAINPQLAKRVASDVESKLRVAQEKRSTLEAEKQQALLARPNLTANAPEFNMINSQIGQLSAEINALSEQLVEEFVGSGGVGSGAEGGAAGMSYVADLKRQAVQHRIEISGLEAKIGVMERRLGVYQQQLSQVPAAEVDLARLERTYQQAVHMHQYVVNRLQEAQISEETQPGYARILDRADVPSIPVGPNKKRDAIKNVLMALLFGLGVGVFRDKLDTRLYKPEDLKERGFSLIGVIPDIRPLLRAKRKLGAHIEQDGHYFSTTFVAMLDPLSTVAEAYRNLRTNIQFSRPDTVVQTIMVTSPAAEEGKSTTAVNLAIVMAQSGRRTLLIDADLRRPKLHDLFKLPMGPGLAQLLFSAQSSFEAEKYRTQIDDLYLIRAGGYAITQEDLPQAHERMTDESDFGAFFVNPAELLGSKRMRELLTGMREQFDVVIIDTPPVLAATDAALLSTQADGTLVVVRAGVSKEGDLVDSRQILSDVGARVLGVLLNGFDLSKAYGYKYRNRYQRYSKYSRYGYSSKKRGWKQIFSRSAA